MLYWGFCWIGYYCRLVAISKVSWFLLASFTTAQFCCLPFPAVALYQMSLLLCVEKNYPFLCSSGNGKGSWCWVVCFMLLQCVSSALRGMWSVPVQHKVNEVGAPGRQVELWLTLLWKWAVPCTVSCKTVGWMSAGRTSQASSLWLKVVWWKYRLYNWFKYFHKELWNLPDIISLEIFDCKIT